MRGIAWRLPYWPWLMRIGLSSASRSGIVSWSASKLIATAQRAPSGQAFGFRLRPARARPTMRRQVASGHCQGSPSGCLVAHWGSLRVPAAARAMLRAGPPATGKSADARNRPRPAVTPRTCWPRFARRALSPVEVLQAVTERVARLNPALNAFAVMNPHALEAAGESAARWRAGRPLGLLDGVPCTVKDLVDVAGFPTRRGSRTTDPDPAADDAPMVVGLKAAGAVIVGKTTTTEFGWKSPGDCPLHGITRNPWNTAHTRPAVLVRAPARRARPGSGRCISAPTPAARSAFRPPGAGWSG